jgi:hypothetical protein
VRSSDGRTSGYVEIWRSVKTSFWVIRDGDETRLERIRRLGPRLGSASMDVDVAIGGSEGRRAGGFC